MMRKTSGLILLAAFTMALTTASCKKKPPAEPPMVVEAPPPAPPPAAPPPAPPPEPPKAVASLQRVYFDLDQSSLRDDAKSALDQDLQMLNAYPKIRLQVQGHCDERGTTEYNMALGQRRANAVRAYFAAHGITPSRVAVISYGEERPLDQGHDESAWSQNRRDEIVIQSGGDDYIKGTASN